MELGTTMDTAAEWELPTTIEHDAAFWSGDLSVWSHEGEDTGVGISCYW